MDTKLTFEELYADLVAASTHTLPENYFTVQQYALDTGMPKRTALDKLKGLAEQGKLESLKVVLNGHETWIFWFPENSS